MSTAPLVLLALALLLAPGEGAARGRTRALLGSGTAERGDRLAAAAPVLVAGLLGAAVALGVGGVAGALGGVGVAVGARVGMRRLGAERAAPVDPLAVAGTFDLLAACLRSGLPVATAVQVVAPTAPQAVAFVLRHAGELLTLGAEPEAAWAAAERAGVLVTGPLGLCFLPAFLCLGVVPVVLGLAGSVLPGGIGG